VVDVILEVPATGERIAAELVEHADMLCLKVAPSGLIAYVLKGVLDVGWRIIDTTPEERAMLRAHGLEQESLDPTA
jgi:hypothetical protein